jgi:hypothetical protein
MAKQEKSTNTTRGLPVGVKMAFAVVAMGAAALFGGCDNKTTPEVCTCPNGTVHENFGCECGGEDCTCTHTFYHLNYGVTLKDQTNGALNEGHIGIINAVLTDLKNDFDYNMNNLEIIVTSGSSMQTNGNNFTVGVDKIADNNKAELFGELNTLLYNG